VGDSGENRVPLSFISDPDTEMDPWAEIWSKNKEPQISSHRPLIGPLVVLLKKLIRSLIKPAVADLFDLQRAFNTILIHNIRRVESEGVKHPKVAKLIKRTDSLFVVLDKRLETLDQQLDGFAEEQKRHSHNQLENLKADYHRNSQITDELSRRLGELRQQQFLQNRRLERLQASGTISAGKTGDVSPKAMKSEETGEKLDHHAYYLFENIFRGTEELIKERQEVYLPYFRDGGMVLDVGCGRGEFLELLQQEGTPGCGIDLNEDMVHVCREKGLTVSEAEALEYLRGLEDNSLGGVFMAQFIEHLEADAIVDCAKLAWAKLEQGGHLIMETQNPLSMIVSARNFYTDLSHIRPIHPEAARFMLQMIGFSRVEVKFLAPFSEREKLQLILEGNDAVPGNDRHLFEKVEQNFKKLNDLLYGYKDFAVIGKK